MNVAGVPAVSFGTDPSRYRHLRLETDGEIAWIVLAEAGVQRFDPYPFAFMSFLSTLAQLIFMIVIMVGQDVLGRAADRRSEQTFLDARAILHECRRMKARLTELGGTVFASSPAEFGAFIAAETEKWGKVVRFSGAKLD